jgi:hypothetical protein
LTTGRFIGVFLLLLVSTFLVETKYGNYDKFIGEIVEWGV